MIDVDRANCRRSEEAHVRLGYDPGLHWHTTGKRINPHVMNRDGLLLLRRWQGGKYPRPAVPQCVGAALRPATTATEKGVTVVDGVYWYEMWAVSGGGVCTRGPGDQAQVAVFDGGAHVGAVPNAPSSVTVTPDESGYAVVSWYYNPVGELVAPTDFAIFGLGPGAIMDWSTPLATVDYVAGQWFYRHRLGPYNNGEFERFQVRARTGSINSLLPERVAGAAGYDPSAWPDTAVPSITVVTSAPAAPPALVS